MIADLNSLNAPSLTHVSHSLNLSAVYKPSDSLLLKSVYEAKIAELEARIAALEPHEPPTPTLPDFYQGFTYREVGEDDYYTIRERQQGVLYFDFNFAIINDDTEYVGVFEDYDEVVHYVRFKWDKENDECIYYLDELNGNTAPLTQDSAGYCKVPDELQNSFDSSIYHREAYLELYSKP